MPKLSLMIHTASPDHFLANQGLASYFQSLVHNLTHQTFRDFELVYTDTFYDHNRERFARIVDGLPFRVKHVPLHPNHRYWFDKGYTFISAAKNTGILYADGELCVTCDDAEFFPNHLLDRYWSHYQHGTLMNAVHRRLTRINVENGLPAIPIGGDQYINDSRIGQIGPGVKRHNGSWSFAGTSFPREAALDLNGFNERMDACKSLEDCEFGERLSMSGKKLLVDGDGYLFILDHASYSVSFAELDAAKIALAGGDGQTTVPESLATPRPIDNLIAIENFGMVVCVRRLFDLVANKHPLTDKHMAIIREETMRYRHFDIMMPEHKAKLDIWLGVPTFDLRAEAAQLRQSGEWRW